MSIQHITAELAKAISKVKEQKQEIAFLTHENNRLYLENLAANDTLRQASVSLRTATDKLRSIHQLVKKLEAVES